MQQSASHEALSVPPSWAFFSADPIGLTDAGLVGGVGSTFIRMRTGAGKSGLAFEQDCDRLMALMSVAANRPIAEAEVLPHVMAAAAHWQRGDKALANLRLVFAKLPKVADPTSAYRVALAEQLLDNGWSSHELLVELGLAGPATGFGKYNPNHVPAGYGRRSGEFDSRHDRITVAEVIEGDEAYEQRRHLGETTPDEDVKHGHPITPTTGDPLIGSRPGAIAFEGPTLDQLSGAASVAAGKVGPGKGPVYGTAVHTEFKAQVQGLRRDDVHPEQSYLNRERVDYGTPGSVRIDVVEGARDRPDKAYDLKTGSASLTRSRAEQLQLHLPLRDDGTEVSIHEVRP
jgi:hypothetical protein